MALRKPGSVGIRHVDRQAAKSSIAGYLRSCMAAQRSRLRHRRRRLGRLRADQSAERRDPELKRAACWRQGRRTIAGPGRSRCRPPWSHNLSPTTATTGSTTTEPQPHVDSRAHVLAARPRARRFVVAQLPWSTCAATPGLRALGRPGERARLGPIAEILPYFRRAETRAKGGDDVSRRRRAAEGLTPAPMKNPLFRRLHRGGAAGRLPLFTADMNGYHQEGFGPMDMTIHRGRRWSAATAYLKPARAGRTCTVETRALTTRVLVEKGRAVGVEYRQGGRDRRWRARSAR